MELDSTERPEKVHITIVRKLHFHLVAGRAMEYIPLARTVLARRNKGH